MPKASTLIPTLTLIFMTIASVASAQHSPNLKRVVDPTGWSRESDASNDRGILTQHADTLPKGDFSLNSYELFFLGLSYGVTDNFQLSITGSIPTDSNGWGLALINGKYVLHRSTHRAISVGTHIFSQDSQRGISAFGFSFNIDQYLDQRGLLALHFAADIQGTFGDAAFKERITTRLTGGLGFQPDKNVRFLAELTTLLGFVPGPESSLEYPGTLFNYGVRFHNKFLAVDLGFLRPIAEDWETLDLSVLRILGVPFVALSAKF